MRNRKRVMVADDAANLALDARDDNGSRINHEALLAYANGLGTVVQAGFYYPRNNGMERDRSQLHRFEASRGVHAAGGPPRSDPA